MEAFEAPYTSCVLARRLKDIVAAVTVMCWANDFSIFFFEHLGLAFLEMVSAAFFLAFDYVQVAILCFWSNERANDGHLFTDLAFFSPHNAIFTGKLIRGHPSLFINYLVQ